MDTPVQRHTITLKIQEYGSFIDNLCPHPQSLGNNQLFISLVLYFPVLLKWNHPTICSLLELSSFSQLNAFQIHPCCMNQEFMFIVYSIFWGAEFCHFYAFCFIRFFFLIFCSGLPFLWFVFVFLPIIYKACVFILMITFRFVPLYKIKLFKILTIDSNEECVIPFSYKMFLSLYTSKYTQNCNYMTSQLFRISLTPGYKR